jgi:hypothetical protein
MSRQPFLDFGARDGWSSDRGALDGTLSLVTTRSGAIRWG